MPFKSQAQRKFLFSQKPEIAKEFAAATPKNAKLPQYVNKSQPSTKGRYDELRNKSTTRTNSANS